MRLRALWSVCGPASSTTGGSSSLALQVRAVAADVGFFHVLEVNGARRPDPGGGRRWHASIRPVWGGELPVLAIIRRGGRRGWIAAVVAGATLGGVSAVPPVLLSRHAAFVLMAVMPGVIGSIYLGSAVMDGQ